MSGSVTVFNSRRTHLPDMASGRVTRNRKKTDYAKMHVRGFTAEEDMEVGQLPSFPDRRASDTETEDTHDIVSVSDSTFTERRFRTQEEVNTGSLLDYEDDITDDNSGKEPENEEDVLKQDSDDDIARDEVWQEKEKLLAEK